MTRALRRRAERPRRRSYRAPAEPRRELLQLVRIVRATMGEVHSVVLGALHERQDADDADDLRRRLEERALETVEDARRAARGRRVEVERVGGGVADRSAVELERIIGIEVFDTPLVSAQVDRFTERMVGYLEGVAEGEVETFRATLRRAAAEGWRSERVAEELRLRANMSEGRAVRIARNELGTLHAEVTRQRQVDAGVEEYIWITSRDERVRDSHRALHGTKHRWDSPPIVDGRPAHPGEPINCRCTASPVIPGIDLRAARAEARGLAGGPRRATPAEAEASVAVMAPTIRRSPRIVGERSEVPVRRELARHMQRTPDGRRVRLRGGGRLNVAQLELGALGEATREGQVVLSSEVAASVARAGRLLDEGVSLQELVRRDPRALDALVTLAHEELHIAAPFTDAAHRRVGRVIEEMVVEAAARVLVDPARMALPIVGAAETSDGHRWMTRFLRIFERHSGITGQLAVDRLEEASLRMMRLPARSIDSPRAAVEAWARLLQIADVDTLERELQELLRT